MRRKRLPYVWELPCNDPNTHDVFPGGRAGTLVQPKKPRSPKRRAPS